jgi:hypothetical protein
LKTHYVRVWTKATIGEKMRKLFRDSFSPFVCAAFGRLIVNSSLRTKERARAFGRECAKGKTEKQKIEHLSPD